MGELIDEGNLSGGLVWVKPITKIAYKNKNVMSLIASFFDQKLMSPIKKLTISLANLTIWKLFF